MEGDASEPSVVIDNSAKKFKPNEEPQVSAPSQEINSSTIILNEEPQSQPETKEGNVAPKFAGMFSFIPKKDKWELFPSWSLTCTIWTQWLTLKRFASLPNSFNFQIFKF